MEKLGFECQALMTEWRALPFTVRASQAGRTSSLLLRAAVEVAVVASGCAVRVHS